MSTNGINKDNPMLNDLTDVERKLFNDTLQANVHLSETNYPLLIAWCKLSLRVAGMETNRESLRFIGELRLLSNSLRLLPVKQQDTTMDLALQLQQGMDEDGT